MNRRATDRIEPVRVEIELLNGDDKAVARCGSLPASAVRRTKVLAIVDDDSAKLVVPQEVADLLGLRREQKAFVRRADGRLDECELAHGVFLKLLRRRGIYPAIIDPSTTTVVVGMIVLEDLDLRVDVQRQRLVPRHPGGPLYLIE